LNISDDDQIDKNSNDDNMSDVTNESNTEDVNNNTCKKTESECECICKSSSLDDMLMDEKKCRCNRNTLDSQSRNRSSQEKLNNDESLKKYLEEEEFLPFDNLSKKDYDKLTESEKKKAISDLFESYDNCMIIAYSY